MGLSSHFYEIEEQDSFQRTAKKFADVASLFQDIQKTFDQFDKIGEELGRWCFRRKKLVEFGKTAGNNSKCKAYVPISKMKLSATRGARLFLAINHSEKKVYLIEIHTKSAIASGQKKSISRKKIGDIFDGV